MRALPAQLQDALGSSVTTLCRCWRLQRTDGVTLGFTDHDQAVTFDGLTFSAMAGLAATSDVARTGLGVGGFDIAGALSSAGLGAQDLIAGKYDFATVTMWLVDWQAPDQRTILREGTLGEVTREDGAFRAEVRGPMQALEAVRGRVFTQTCDADLGDGRCRVDLGLLRRTTTVVRVDGRRVVVHGLSEVSGWASDGIADVMSGTEAGARIGIALHSAEGDLAALVLRGSTLGLSEGDLIELIPGCDKRFGTCLGKFANTVNFQGFPHLPGNDRAFAVAKAAE